MNMTTLFTLTDKTTLGEIREMLNEDGFPSDQQVARKVKRAFRDGRLVWTVNRLTIIGPDALDYQPFPRS